MIRGSIPLAQKRYVALVEGRLFVLIQPQEKLRLIQHKGKNMVQHEGLENTLLPVSSLQTFSSHLNWW